MAPSSLAEGPPMEIFVPSYKKAWLVICLHNATLGIYPPCTDLLGDGTLLRGVKAVGAPLVVAVLEQGQVLGGRASVHQGAELGPCIHCCWTENTRGGGLRIDLAASLLLQLMMMC